MEIDILKNRVKTVRKILVQKGLDALLITGAEDVSCLSGFSGDDSWLIIGKKDVWLITDSRYTLMAKEECNCKIYNRKGTMAEAVRDVLKKNGRVRHIAVEDNIKLASFNSLKKKINCRVKPVQNPVSAVRQIKDKTEIKAIRKAAALGQKSLNKILPKIRIGISEVELAAMLEFEIKRQGAVPAFETIVAFGNNSAKPHHRPTTRRLKKVDTILIDFGAKLNGYCCDLTRCFAVGRVSNFYAKAYKTVLDAQTSAINMLKAGIKAKDADLAAKEFIKKAKLPAYGHGLGHGIGLEVHEKPVVSHLSKDILQNGNVITVEPAVYLAGKFGVRIEDDVLITEKGCEVLSALLRSEEVPVLK